MLPEKIHGCVFALLCDLYVCGILLTYIAFEMQATLEVGSFDRGDAAAVANAIFPLRLFSYLFGLVVITFIFYVFGTIVQRLVWKTDKRIPFVKLVWEGMATALSRERRKRY